MQAHYYVIVPAEDVERWQARPDVANGAPRLSREDDNGRVWALLSTSGYIPGRGRGHAYVCELMRTDLWRRGFEG